MKTHKQTIQLSKKAFEKINCIIRRGKNSARVITRARILRLSHNSESKDAIAKRLSVGRSTVQRIRDHYRNSGLDRALYDAPRPGQPRKLDDVGEAHLVALACSDPPEGHAHWTMELLRKQMVQDKKVPKEITVVALWKRLNNRGIKPWREKNVVHSKGR